jgi:hypothetical protein
MSDSKLRDDALSEVKVASVDLGADPDHLYMNRNDGLGPHDEAHHLVFDLLKEESEAIWQPK